MAPAEGAGAPDARGGEARVQSVSAPGDAAPLAHHAYGSLSQPRAAGGAVALVESGSAAEAAGLLAGDVLLTADGLALRDVIDWQWIADSERVEVVYERGGSRATTWLEREPGEPWGVAFASPVFDRIRTCRNDCAFCFMSQLPRGLRRSLYLRDDDFRLSFLSGTFITLTNLADADVARIATQRLSPLHVSLHAVTPGVRELLVCARGEDIALERFDELVAARIELHVQIVLVPGVNDGEELDRSLAWLAERGEAVASVGVVPLGYTRHQERFVGSYESAADAAAVLDQLAAWQERMRAELEITWVQAADELYLAAGREMPPAEEYDDFPQYENGIGMVRAFQDDWGEALSAAMAPDMAPAVTPSAASALAPPVTPTLTPTVTSAGTSAVTADVTSTVTPTRTSTVTPDPASGTPAPVLVTGQLFAPVLSGLLAEAVAALPAAGRVLPVPNAAFGGNVTVAGLLTGADIAAAIATDVAAHGPAATYLVPDLVLNDHGLTLDDMTLAQVAETAGVSLVLVSSSAPALLEALGAPSPEPETGEV